MRTIECQAPDCQNRFEPRAWNTKFCSNACKQANYRATHPERRARPKQREEWSNSRANRTRTPDDRDPDAGQQAGTTGGPAPGRIRTPHEGT